MMVLTAVTWCLMLIKSLTAHKSFNMIFLCNKQHIPNIPLYFNNLNCTYFLMLHHYSYMYLLHTLYIIYSIRLVTGKLLEFLWEWYFYMEILTIFVSLLVHQQTNSIPVDVHYFFIS